MVLPGNIVHHACQRTQAGVHAFCDPWQMAQDAAQETGFIQSPSAESSSHSWPQMTVFACRISSECARARAPCKTLSRNTWCAPASFVEAEACAASHYSDIFEQEYWIQQQECCFSPLKRHIETTNTSLQCHAYHKYLYAYTACTCALHTECCKCAPQWARPRVLVCVHEHG